MLNASNGRFYHLSLSNKLPFHLIGTDQGLVSAPVSIGKIMIALVERLDLVVDFKDSAGSKILLNDDSVSLLEFRVSGERVNDDSALAKFASYDREAAGIRGCENAVIVAR